MKQWYFRHCDGFIQLFSSVNESILVETVTSLLPYILYRLDGFNDSTLGKHSSVQNEQISTWVKCMDCPFLTYCAQGTRHAGGPLVVLLDYPHGDECVKPGLACLSHLGIPLQRVPSPDRLPSILVKLLVSLSGRLHHLAVSHTNCSVRGSHQATFSKQIRCDLFTVKLPLQNSAYTAGFLISRVVMSRRCTATARA